MTLDDHLWAELHRELDGHVYISRDQFERGLLQGARYEEGVDDLDGPQPFENRTARGQRAHAEAGRGRLGERARVQSSTSAVLARAERSPWP